MSSEKTERVLIHTFDGSQWSKSVSEISIAKEPFAQGAFRQAYKSTLCRAPATTPSVYVCKMAIDRNTPRSLYLHDVEAQVYAKGWADKFNSYIPTDPSGAPALTPIAFVDAFIVELAERPGRPLTGCELFIPGDFTKHNNNVGAVVDGLGGAALVASDIANAFSHFTFDRSQRTILICDIQGVGSSFTDPQIHTASGKGFGAGNLGHTGIKAFLLRHQCGPACRKLGLPPIVNKDLAVNEAEGAVDANMAASLPSAAAGAALPVISPAAPTQPQQTAPAPVTPARAHIDGDFDDVAALLSEFDSPAPAPAPAPAQVSSWASGSGSGSIPAAAAVASHTPLHQPPPAPRPISDLPPRAAQAPRAAPPSLGELAARARAPAISSARRDPRAWAVDFSGAAEDTPDAADEYASSEAAPVPNAEIPVPGKAIPRTPEAGPSPRALAAAPPAGKTLARTPEAGPSAAPALDQQDSFDLSSSPVFAGTPSTPPRPQHDDFDFDLSLTPRSQPRPSAPAPVRVPAALTENRGRDTPVKRQHAPAPTPLRVGAAGGVARVTTNAGRLDDGDEDLINSILDGV